MPLRPKVRGICGVGLDEERHLADERRDVVGVRAEADVAVAVGRRAGGDDDRPFGSRRSSIGTSLKWHGTRSTAPSWKRGRVTCDRK